jgi:Na+-transporting methylmalonyl-CoA/oxaloacetate decarboxylase beta subunit
MDSDLANIGLICLLMGVGIVMFIGIIFVYLAVNEFLETWLLKD